MVVFGVPRGTFLQMSNICPRCRKNERRKGGYECLRCHADYMKAHPQVLSVEARKKMNARSYANVYLRRGKITRDPCMCGNPDSEMHHEDYDYPLRIIWMCRNCHLEYHNGRIIDYSI